MYRHLFFDLDRTLWDFETNSYQTLTELAHSYRLADRGVDSIDNFINVIVDTSTQQLSGNFKVTFVNKSDPYDTLRMSCPSFNCYW